MPTRLHYFARAVRNAAGVMQGGEPHRFVTAQDAEDGGALLARLEGAAVAYQQMGDAETDIWDEPELLGVYGELTEAAVIAAVA